MKNDMPTDAGVVVVLIKRETCSTVALVRPCSVATRLMTTAIVVCVAFVDV